MIWVISFLALVASTLGCGVRPVRVYNPDYAAMLAKRSVSLAEDLPKRLPRRLPKYLLDELSEDLSEELPEKLPEELPSVIGGRPVDIDHVWPWQVSIQTSTGQLECGGTLISQIWILTAAHCLVQPGKYIVVLGQYDRFKNENSQVMEIAKFITHPKHNKQTEHNNDIALLKLSSPVQMTSFISPICLHSFTSIPSGMLTRCVTTGWGKTETVLNPQFLQEATVPIVNQTQCRRVWGRRKITEGMICAGASGASSCRGDSGGPLMCESSGVWYQVGIVSWGHEECITDHPVVYTRVSYFQKWINETIRLN